jgi:Protein of unknown function (DUF1552)
VKEETETIMKLKAPSNHSLSNHTTKSNMITNRHLPRRSLLRATGVSLTLPFLDAMLPAFATERQHATTTPKRMVNIMTDLGMLSENFFPRDVGTNYKASKYLAILDGLRDKYTVFSGLSHPEVDGAHAAEQCFLTGAPHPLRGGFRNTISLDQYAADHIGKKTRFPSLSLQIGQGANSLSWTADGVRIPPENRASRAFASLFLSGSESEKQQRMRQIREGQSLMDAVGNQVNRLQKDVGPTDRQRLDQFFTAVRDFETRLKQSEEWEHKPRPKVDQPPPQDFMEPELLIKRTQSMFDVIRLAIETDSTRLISVIIGQSFNPKVDLPGVELPHHALTHKSSLNNERKQLEIIETSQLQQLAKLLSALNETKEEGESLLNRTMVLYGSNLGNAARHDTTNLPILLAGAGFQHGRHMAFDQQNNKPLSNLFVTMLQRLGIESDRFSSSNGSLSELESKP